MALLRFGQITNAEVYFEDNTLVGMVKEFKIPKIAWQSIDHETLGQVAVWKAPARPMQALEGSVKFGFVDPDVAAMTYMPTRAWRFQIHHDVDVWGQDGLDTDKSYKLVTAVRLLFTESELGGAKLGDLVEHDAPFTCTRFVQRVYSEQTPLIGVDVMANRIWGKYGDPWPE